MEGNSEGGRLDDARSLKVCYVRYLCGLLEEGALILGQLECIHFGTNLETHIRGLPM